MINGMMNKHITDYTVDLCESMEYIMKKALAIIGALICGFLCNALICGFLGFLFVENLLICVICMILIIPGFALLVNTAAKKFGIYRGIFIACAQLPIFSYTLVYFIINRINYTHAWSLGIFGNPYTLSYSLATALFIPSALTTLAAFITMFIISYEERNGYNSIRSKTKMRIALIVSLLAIAVTGTAIIAHVIHYRRYITVEATVFEVKNDTIVVDYFPNEDRYRREIKLSLFSKNYSVGDKISIRCHPHNFIEVENRNALIWLCVAEGAFVIWTGGLLFTIIKKHQKGNKIYEPPRLNN